VKLEVDTLPTVPTVPPDAGPERAFDAPAAPGLDAGKDRYAVVGAAPAAAEPPPAVALTMPYVPPPIASAAAPAAIDLVIFRENIPIISFVVF
jgi:hypothetical protein